MAVKKLEHVGVMVEEMGRSIAFYRDLLGLDVLQRPEHSNSSIKLAFLGLKQTGEVIVELVEGANSGLPNEGKVNHIAFTVDNIEEEMERLKRHQVTFTDEEINHLGDAKYIFFKGPDGESLELFQPAE